MTYSTAIGRSKVPNAPVRIQSLCHHSGVASSPSLVVHSCCSSTLSFPSNCLLTVVEVFSSNMSELRSALLIYAWHSAVACRHMAPRCCCFRSRCFQLGKTSVAFSSRPTAQSSPPPSRRRLEGSSRAIRELCCFNAAASCSLS